MSRRVLQLVGASAAGAILVLAVAHFAFGVGLPDNARESRANMQQVVWSAQGDSTNSQEWETIANLGGTVCTNTPVSATVSLALRGGPARIRVLREGTREGRALPIRALRPGPVDATPAAGSPFSFTFVDPSGRRGARGFLGYEVQWRSLTSEPVEFDRGTAAFSFGRPARMACPD